MGRRTLFVVLPEAVAHPSFLMRRYFVEVLSLVDLLLEFLHRGVPGIKECNVCVLTLSTEPLAVLNRSLVPDLPPTEEEATNHSRQRHPLAYLLRRPRGASQRAFSKGLHAAYMFWRRHEHFDVPYGYLHEEDGQSLHLGRWIAERRRNVTQLRAEQIAALEALDMRWIPRPSHTGA
ncbi:MULTISPECIES: helicase associated domain-containing protein [unclassified Streptomyces]|uniref:helicase associated domain-containing protein n=2 Tax=unclassified Streptomyces TaxID=2593676 RepID=UPI002DDB0E17|nr:helicase associated domain-containing protein [Streptomyces sp. NBC_01591]